MKSTASPISLGSHARGAQEPAGGAEKAAGAEAQGGRELPRILMRSQVILMLPALQ